MLEDVEKKFLKWFKKASDSNIPMSGALVREKARETCISNGVEHIWRVLMAGYRDFKKGIIFLVMF